jgi:hypothetical protein
MQFQNESPDVLKKDGRAFPHLFFHELFLEKKLTLHYTFRFLKSPNVFQLVRFEMDVTYNTPFIFLHYTISCCICQPKGKNTPKKSVKRGLVSVVL